MLLIFLKVLIRKLEINTKKLIVVLQYVSENHNEKEIRETISFTIVSKIHLGITLIKQQKAYGKT